LPVRKTKQISGKRDTYSCNIKVHGIYITAISVRLRAGVGTVMRLSTLQIIQHEKLGQWNGNCKVVSNAMYSIKKYVY
jgi:hypothetical protein